MRTRKTMVLLVALALIAVPTAVLASHNFQDVPTTEFYHDPVSEIAEAKVTIGCNVERTNYCPDDPTTRGQMATFLSRGMGRVAFASGAAQPVADATPVEIASVNIEAGGAESGGTANIKLDVAYLAEEATTGDCDAAACEVTVELRDGEGNVLQTSRSTLNTVTLQTVSQSGSITWVQPVDTAATHTFSVFAWLSEGAGTVGVSADISAIYAPFSTPQG